MNQECKRGAGVVTAGNEPSTGCLDLRDAALRYAAQGRPVFPCAPRVKRPLTEHGLKDATTDPGLIDAWWEQWPDANVAMRTGAPSRVVVLDTDGDEGAESRRGLERAHGPLPRTASVVTPNGGQHFYLAHPGVDVPNSAGKLGAGLDVRGDGGYVLVPPSIGSSGRRYEPDERSAIAPMPDWLQGALTRPHGERHDRTPASAWAAIVRDGLRQGERNHGLARLTGHLLSKNVDARLVREIAHLVNGRCKPPLTSHEVDCVVESIAGCELRKRRNGTRR
jgi:hypothetical protein